MEIKKVTPAFAQSLLDSNTSNRKVNKTQLNMLVRVMLDGKWRLTHQGVAIYSDGELADGQHRLLAVIESGVTCEMPVFYGISKETETVIAIDCGKQRSVIDSASISGLDISINTVTLARGFEFGYGTRMSKLTHSETVEICSKHKRKVDLISRVFPTNRKGVSIAPVKVAVADAVFAAGVSESVAKSFCSTLVTGEYGDQVMKNAIRLRNKLMGYNYNGGQDRVQAYNMTYNTLVSTMNNLEVKRMNQQSPK